MVGWIGRTFSGLFSTVGVSHSRSDEIVSRELELETSRLFDASKYPSRRGDYALDLALWIIEELKLPLTTEFIKSIADAIDPLLISNAVLPPEIDWDHVDHDGEEGRQLRLYLERHKRFHQNHAISDRKFRQGLLNIFGSLLSNLPSIPFSEGSSGFGVQLGDVVIAPDASVDRLIGSAFDGELQEGRLFQDLQQQLEINLAVASGIDLRSQSPSGRYRMPQDFRGSREDLYRSYLSYTPFKRLLETPLPFSIPAEARFEHTHIVGGTGQGKTQLLSHFILQDMAEILGGKQKSIILIDSQGDLVRKIASMAVFNPSNVVGLADKLVLIDPRDIYYPTALNIFAINEHRLNQYGAMEHERVFNGAVELYEHFFRGLLGAELTAKQGVAFTYMARMMLELPNATIHTLRDLMDNPENFRDQFEKLSPSTRMFFERELLSKAYNGTRRQISQRLWGMLSVPAFERMFGQSENKVDLFELMNSGKIILINASKDLLKEEGSAIFGKFFLAAIAQAVGERAVLNEAERTETIIYLDEAHEYADQSLEVLLNQGRKYRAGVLIAHQYLDQLDARTKQALLTNASIKLVGGLSYRDNQAFAREMGTTPDFLSSLKKEERSKTEFALWIKHQIPEAIKLTVPFGLLESAKRLDAFSTEMLLIDNRDKYCVEARPFEHPEPEPETPPQTEPVAEAEQEEPTTPFDLEGRGGTQHREIQQMIKDIGHDLGFGASIEAACQNGDGAIDVLLAGEHNSFAIEVSVTTGPTHELANIQKCLAEPIDQIICVSPDDPHRLEIQNLCIERLPQTQLPRVKFLNPNSVAEYLAQYDERETTLMRGYEVLTKVVQGDPRDVEYRKNRIRQILQNAID